MKKPILQDYGLTEEQVKSNLKAKKDYYFVLSANEKIDNKAIKYGWGTFFVVLFIVMIVLIQEENLANYSIFFVAFAVIIGLFVNWIIKQFKEQLPLYSKIIDEKYNKYLVDLETYKKTLLFEINKDYNNLHSNDVCQEKEQRHHINKLVSTDLIPPTNSNENSAKISTLSTSKNIKIKNNQQYEIGMVVNHPKFGEGIVKGFSPDSKIIYVSFSDSEYKPLAINIAPLTIVKRSEIKQTTENINSSNTSNANETIEKTVDEQQNITKKFANSKICLNKEQEIIFNKLLNISLQFCLDLKVDDRNNLVGICIPKQEQWRWWLTNGNGVKIKFKDNPEAYSLKNNNLPLLIELTKAVNKKFEDNPDSYLLKKEPAPQPIKEIKNKDIIETNTYNSDENVVENIQIPINVETSTDNILGIKYNKEVFTISGMTLIKCNCIIGKSAYDIPNGITEIASNCFENQTRLFSLNIPSSVTSIGDEAFKNCNKLYDLFLPASIKIIGKDVFEGCVGLETLFVETKAVSKLLINLPKSIEIVCLE